MDYGMKIINKDLLAEFRAKSHCEFCRRYSRSGLQPHHCIVARGMGAGSQIDHRWNIISLCSGCHDRHHGGYEPLTCDLTAIIAKREGCLQDELERAVFAIREAPKGTEFDMSWSPREWLEKLAGETGWRNWDERKQYEARSRKDPV